MISKHIDGSQKQIGSSWQRKKFQRSTNPSLSNSFDYIVRGKGDASNYSSYPDSTELPKAIKPADDPFLNW